MKNFAGKTAVVTGAASGIGRSIAERCIREGMHVVLADVEADALLQAEREMRRSGAQLLAAVTDVARLEDVEALAKKTLDAFGSVDLLCNNAGVGIGASAWETTINDWKWVLGVNLWGVIHGVRVFLPIMLRQQSEGHIVNTSSIAGLTSGPGGAAYKVSKHGVVTLSETLQQDLAQRHAKIGVSVLCPAFVQTRIFDADRNRPGELRDDLAAAVPDPEAEALTRAGRKSIEEGLHPSAVADLVFDAIKEDRLYVFTDRRAKAFVERRMAAILAEANWKGLPG